MRFAFIAISFILSFSLQAQNTDSFVRAVDSSTKAMRQRITATEDSLYKMEVQRSLQQNNRNLDRFLADMKEREKREERQMYIRLGIGVLFLAVLIIGLLRKRKQAAKNKITD